MLDTMKAKVLGAGVGLALLGTAIGGVTLTGITAAGAQTPVATQSQAEETPDAPEANESAEQPEANEQELPGGHEDPDGGDVQHEFQGVE